MSLYKPSANESEIFSIIPREFWEGFGTELVGGRLSRPGGSGNAPRIGRTGPFVPPACVMNGTVVVSETTRDLMLRECPGDFQFRKCVYDLKDMTESYWHTWDFSSPTPNALPKSGNPSEYVFRLPAASADIVSSMETSWELIRSAVPARFRESGINFLDLPFDIPAKERHQISAPRLELSKETLVDAKKKGFFTSNFSDQGTLVAGRAKDWVVRHLGDWVDLMPNLCKVL